MAGEILRLKQDEVTRLFAEAEMEVVNTAPPKPEGSSDIDRLHGDNSTLQLVRLIKGYTGQNDRETRFFVICLQNWAVSLYQKIVQAATTNAPQTRFSLEQMINQMIKEGDISDTLTLANFKPYTSDPPHHDYFHSILPLNSLREHQWVALETLFGIDISRIEPLYAHGKADLHAHDGHLAHKYMLQLIDEALQKKGSKLERINWETKDRPKEGYLTVETYQTSSGLRGVSMILATINDTFDIPQPPTISAISGYPDLWEVLLKFDPLFLASVKPLSENEYLKYVPKEL